MAGLVCLGLEATPGYISSRSFRPVTIASALNTLFHITPSSPSPSLILDESRGLGCDSLLHGTLKAYCLLPSTYLNHSLTRFFTHYSFAHLHSLSVGGLGPWTRQFWSLLPTLDTGYNPLLCEASSKPILSPPLISPLPVRNSTPHTTVDSSWPSTHELDRPSHCLLRQASNSIDLASLFETSPLLLSLTPPCLTLGGGRPCCHLDFLGLYSIMAPTIQVLVARTFNILKNVLKKRTNANQILKEREKKMLSREDYN